MIVRRSAHFLLPMVAWLMPRAVWACVGLGHSTYGPTRASFLGAERHFVTSPTQPVGWPCSPDTTVLLGRVQRDLTGDGKPETLTVVGFGPTVEQLDSVMLAVTSEGHVVFQYRMSPLTHTVGYDAGVRVISAVEHRTRLQEYSQWFFDDNKFAPPAAFMSQLGASSTTGVARIPEVMAQYREPGDSVDTRVLWAEMQRTPILVFSFSPGGDTVISIAWSQRTKRFYRLIECC